MIQLFRNYCEQAAFYGVKDLFYARSKFTKIFWTLILVIAVGMTILQMYYIVENFIYSPTKTEITLLPSNVKPKYPPFYFALTDFTEWIDLSKIKTFGFDLGTFFYFMSYFCPIYTRFHFDVAAAERNLWQIMKKQNISSLYDLAIEVSASKPLSLVNDTDNFFRAISYYQELVYVSNAMFNEKQQYTLEFITAGSIVYTEFYSEFINLFNFNLTEEYNFLTTWIHDTEYSLNDDAAHSRIPFYFNTVGTDIAVELDVFTSNYIFFISGTLYKWQSMSEAPCNDGIDSKFEIECDLECGNMFKEYSISSCSLYFNDDVDDSKNWNKQSCLFNLSFFGNIDTSYTNDSYDICKENCLSSSCKEWKYNYQLTMSINTDILKSNNVVKSKGYIHLVYEKSRNVLVISETPSTTWNDALASTGGLLGLWLGGSIISFVQVFYIFCCVPVESWFIGRYKGGETMHSTTAVHQSDKTSNKLCRCEIYRNVHFELSMPQRFFLSNKEELGNVKASQQVTTRIKFLEEKMKNVELKLNHLLKEHKI